MTAPNRLPSFNDFSPGIIGSIKECLQIVAETEGDRAAGVTRFREKYFEGEDNKRSRVNLPTSLGPKGLDLVDLRTWSLTELGREALAADNEKRALLIVLTDVIERRNGDKLLDAVRTLEKREHRGSFKSGLKTELASLGITDLSTATTDHTTLANWMVKANLLVREGRTGYRVNEDGVRDVLGITTDDRAELASLRAGQQLIIKWLRMAHEHGESTGIRATNLIETLLTKYPGLFPEDQFAKSMLKPLEESGFIEVEGRTSGRGARSGIVRATRKLLAIPIDQIQPDFGAAIPRDLRAKLQTPRQEILRMLKSRHNWERGFGLELLVLRMLSALGLEVRGFRKRSRETAHAEIDLLAEGAALVFSRWTIQCKCHKTAKVDLHDVAKEVGIAIHQKAHVVCVSSVRLTREGNV
ncbi:MAG: restriction endonuclease [Dehalococcoidia bacterium]